MTNYDLIALLGKAFADGEVDALAPHLAKDCIYYSEYASKGFSSAEQIVERMKQVYSELDETDRYTYMIERISEVTDPKKAEAILKDLPNVVMNEYCLYLYQYDGDNPAAIAILSQNSVGEICEILLTRNVGVFDIPFYAGEGELDSPYDLPSTVTPLTPHDRQVKELRRAFSGQHLDDIPEEEKDHLYILRQSDLFIIG